MGGPINSNNLKTVERKEHPSTVIFFESKRKAFWVLGALFGVTLCFSIIYLGLHFPSDIVGGVIVGLFVEGLKLTCNLR